jgi:hypothetical protein
MAERLENLPDLDYMHRVPEEGLIKFKANAVRVAMRNKWYSQVEKKAVNWCHYLEHAWHIYDTAWSIDSSIKSVQNSLDNRIRIYTPDVNRKYWWEAVAPAFKREVAKDPYYKSSSYSWNNPKGKWALTGVINIMTPKLGVEISLGGVHGLWTEPTNNVKIKLEGYL